MTHSINLIRSLLLPGMIGSLLFLSGCSGMPEKQAGEIPAQHSVDDVVRDDVTYSIDVYDPWEGFNRGAYRFNAGFDKYIFLPVVSVYEAVLPDFVEDGISNFFSNIFEFTNFYNSLLQLKPRATGETLARFVINSTVGLAGLFDVAEKWVFTNMRRISDRRWVIMAQVTAPSSCCRFWVRPTCVTPRAISPILSLFLH